MAQLKHIFKGESLTMLFTFPESYDMARLQKHEVYINDTAFTGVVSGQAIELKLTSEQTDAMYGRQEIRLWLDDSVLGVKKPYCGDIIVYNSNAKPANDSTSSVSDIIIPIIISETAIRVGDVMYNYVKGDKGDTGKYGETKFVINDNMELEQHTLIGDPLNFAIVDDALVLTEGGETVNLGKVRYHTYNQLTDPTLTGTVINGDRWIYGGIPFTIYERIYDVWMVTSGGYNSSFIPKIGDYYICGTVFYIDTVNRFIMVADLDAMVKKYWMKGNPPSFVAQDLSINSGEINTDTIISATSSADTAALYCKNYEKEGYADWFLPTLYNTEILNGFISILPVNANPWTSESYSDYRYAYYVSAGTKRAEYSFLPKDTIPVKKINY